jgi:predicted nucleic acid-binding Zn ribbon protein
MRRRGPRPVATALESFVDALDPPPIAAVQRVWEAAAGPVFARHAEPVSLRDGEVRVRCREAVRAQELDLMSELVVARLNDALGKRVVERLKVQVR